LDRSIDMQTTIDTAYNNNKGNQKRGAAGTVLSFHQKNMMQRFSSQLNSISPGDYNLSNNLMQQTSSNSAGFKTKYYKERMMNEQMHKQISALEE